MTDAQAHNDLMRRLKGIRHIVINVCYGGFELSHEAQLLYLTRSGVEYTLADQESRDETERLGQRILVNNDQWPGSDYIPRDDPILVSMVRELGDKANGRYAKLKIVEIPADVSWTINDYDGNEWIAEVHRRWR